jgi:hypothetical protein
MMSRDSGLPRTLSPTGPTRGKGAFRSRSARWPGGGYSFRGTLRWIAVALPLAMGSCGAGGKVATALVPLDDPEAISRWTLDGSGTWEVRDGMLVLSAPGTPGGRIRRPAALAILDMESVGRATISAELRSTAPVDVLQRDLEVIFGYESPTRFYYVHLSGLTDAVHNGIFLVDDADRRRLDDGTAEPHLRDQKWHHVRVERDGATGSIEVYIDNADAPALRASDTTIPAGRVGFGSFDDTGEFRRISFTDLER